MKWRKIKRKKSIFGKIGKNYENITKEIKEMGEIKTNEINEEKKKISKK